MAEDPIVTSAHPISKKLILCVDDDEAILQYEKTLLELSGYAVLTASSGKHALQLVTTSELDVMILDGMFVMVSRRMPFGVLTH